MVFFQNSVFKNRDVFKRSRTSTMEPIKSEDHKESRQRSFCAKFQNKETEGCRGVFRNLKKFNMELFAKTINV